MEPIRWMRGWYSPPPTLQTKSGPAGQEPTGQKISGKRRIVIARHGPYRDEHHSITKHYQGNRICTTKYTVLNFIPKNLFQQFHRAANLYFLFLVLLNWVPVVEAFQKEITMIPLVVVLGVIAFKDAVEDYRRYCFDKMINNNLTRVYCGKQQRYVPQHWKDVCVGDFVRLSCNESIPADMVLLYSSDPGGVCYIETANLDGETNLKQRQVVRVLADQDQEITPDNFNSRIECESPNDELSRFRGFMEYPNKTRVGLHNENLLLRSCTVRNTETVVGIVVYAGHETKAMKNNSGPRYKRSKLERRLNVDVMWSVVLLILMCLTTAVGHGLWLSGLKNPPFIISDDTSPAFAGFCMFWTMIIVLQVLIPISLYISIEIVKLGQVYFIQNDLEFYDERLDSTIQCRALNITEDLGQVQYVFSDKTGTLTENKMVFRRCSVAGVEYPHEHNALRLEIYQSQNVDVDRPTTIGKSRNSLKSLSCRSLSCNRSSVSLHTLTAGDLESDQQGELLDGGSHRHVAFSSRMEKDVIPDPKLRLKLDKLSTPELPVQDGAGDASLEITYIVDFFLALALCNTVVVSSANQPLHTVQEFPRTPLKSLEALQLLFQRFSISRISSLSPMGSKTSTTWASPSSSESPNDHQQDEEEVQYPGDAEEELLYEAESPDEAALVHAARAYHCTLRARTAEQLLVELPGLGRLTVPLLHVLPFDAVRKRMSVVVRHPLTNQVVVYAKGADSVIMDLLAHPKGDENSKILEQIRAQTQKHLDEYAREGLRTLCIAKRVLEEAEYGMWLKRHMCAEASIEDREELLQETALDLETNLTLLGATGIVDRLQKDVPETIEALQRAGIRLWVLTGDKQETAVNIARSCRLLRHSDDLLTANCESKEACVALLAELHRTVTEAGGRTWAPRSDGSGFTLVIDGRTLEFALQEEMQDRFVELSRGCRAVVVCRATPLQKSQVVHLIQDKLGVLTLAVGDGANDVSMIQVADVGIGISGQEGMQAVMSSDFAISRFRHLHKLLLVHGQWCYTRLANMILYFFYKNVAYVNLLFWYQFFCGFSGSTMTNYWVLIFFNLLFTSAPPLLFGILDRDVSANTLMLLPELYQAGQKSQAYIPSTFWLTMLDALYQSLVCFFIPYLAYADTDISVFSFGTPINTSALFIILLHLVTESNTLTWLHTLVLVGSAAFYFAFTLVFSAICVTCNAPANPLAVDLRHMQQPIYYCVCVLTTVLALIPRIVYRSIQNTVSPTDLVHAAQLDTLRPEERQQAKPLLSVNVTDEGKGEV